MVYALLASMALMWVFGVIPEMWDQHKKSVDPRPPRPDTSSNKGG